MKLGPVVAIGCLVLCQTTLAEGESLVPTYVEGQERAARHMAHRLEQTLRKWPAVSDARVHIAPSDLSRVPIDGPAPAPRVSAWLALRGAGPDEASLRALLSAGWPGVTAESIAIVCHQVARDTPPPPVRISKVGPFRVAGESAPRLRAALALLLATNVLLAAIVVVRGRRGGNAG